MQTAADLNREPATPPYAQKPVTLTPLSIRSSSSLTEDFLSRQDLFLNQAGSTLALYRNPFNNDLIEAAVAVDGNCSTLTRGQDGSTWQLEKYATTYTPDGCTEVVSVVYPGGTPGVVATTPGWLYYFDITADGPKYVDAYALSSVSSLKVSYTPPLPQRIPVVYGASPHGNLMITRWDHRRIPRFEAYTVDVGGSLAGGDFVLGSFNWVEHVLMTVVGGVLTWYTIDFHGQNGGPYQATGLGIRQILTIYQRDYRTFDAVVLGEDGHLYLTTLGRTGGGTFERIGDVTAVSGTGVRDADSLMHLYLVGADNKLSVLHQTGWDASNTPLFTSVTNQSGAQAAMAIPFASGVSAVAVDQYPVDHPVLVTFAATGTSKQGEAPVRLIGQDAVTQQWWTESVQLADKHFYKVSRWQTRATLLDRDGQPVPLHYVSLHAETTTTVDVGGETYVLDPQRRTHVEIRTDLRGQVVFSQPALGLVVPAVTVSAEGLPAGAEIRPDQAVQSYLAGTGKLLFKPTFDGRTLQNATVNGRPLVPPIIWNDKRTPEAAVEGMRSIIALADPNLPTPKHAGFMLQMYAPDRPFFQTFASADELEAARGHLRSLPEFGGWWDAVTDFASEVWQGIKAGAIAVVGAIVDVTKQAVELAINIGGKLYKLGELAIQTLSDAFNAVGAAFNMLLVKANELIEWFQRAFSWQDMWNTHKAIDQALRGLGPVMAGYVTTAKNFVDHKFLDELPGKIDAAFASVGGRFDNITIGELNTRDGQPSFLSGLGYVLEYIEWVKETLVDPVATWLLDKILGPWAGLLSKALPSVVLPSLEPLRQPAERLLAALQAVFGELETAFADLFAWLASTLSSRDGDPAGSFESAAFNGLMSVLHRISLSGVQAIRAIADALFDVLGAGVSLIGTFLDSKIDVGVIGDVWAWFQKQVGIRAADQSALTLGGLVSLVVAIPATVYYKLMYGVDAQPFPGGVLPPADAAATDHQGGDACVQVGVWAAIFNNLLLGAADAYIFARKEPEEGEILPLLQRIETWFGFGSLALAIVANTFTWPSESAIPGPIDLSSPGARATFANWIANWLPVVADFGFSLFSGVITESKRFGLVMQFVDPLGVYVDATLAAVTLITGIVESGVAHENVAQWFSNIMQPWATITLPIRSLTAVQYPPLELYLAWLFFGKLVIDAFSAGGAALKVAWMPSLRDARRPVVAA